MGLFAPGVWLPLLLKTLRNPVPPTGRGLRGTRGPCRSGHRPQVLPSLPLSLPY